MQKRTFSVPVGDTELIAEFTDLADQAHGSVIMRYGNSAVLVTAVMSENTRDNIDYFPLTVDYEERFYAAGAILGSRFQKREGRPTDEAVLSGRIIDRTIRPLFDSRMRNEVQIIATVLSIDDRDPDVLGVIGASLALATSHIPWNGPVAGVRIGVRKDSSLCIHPPYKEREAGELAAEILACGKNGTINMIEVGAREVSESIMEEGLREALRVITAIEDFQKRIAAEIGKPKRVMELPEISEAVVPLFKERFV